MKFLIVFVVLFTIVIMNLLLKNRDIKSSNSAKECDSTNSSDDSEEVYKVVEDSGIVFKGEHSPYA